MKAPKTLFSKSDLYHLADELVMMHNRMKLILDFAKMDKNQVLIDAYSGIVWELDLLISAYGMQEMVKIN